MKKEESVLTDEEIAAFDGLEESYREMERELIKVAPICHFRPMNYESEVDGYYSEQWWECSVCGHTKDMSESKKCN